jgi:hypothetical protein
MMTNIELFEYSGQHPEPIVDPYYNRDKIVIPQTAAETNALVEKNARLIELITVFGFFVKQGKKRNDPDVVKVVSEVCEILVKTAGINFSPFSQFFMVYNSSHNSFMNYSPEERFEFIYEMLTLYVRERHPMYQSHGYTNSILQVVCDNYSHKRNSKTTIVKICDMIGERGFVRANCIEDLLSKKCFILPDKGDEELFVTFRRLRNVEMESAKNEQNKLPDMVFNLDGNFFIVEMKSMKGSGGGQDKQLTEVINFVRYAEKDPKIHYVTYLDGEYSNLLHGTSQQPKIRCQYDDAVSCLRKNPGNYFLNTAGFKKFVSEWIA